MTNRSQATKLTASCHRSPKPDKIDLFSIQNLRLNELREKIKSKLETRRSMQGTPAAVQDSVTLQQTKRDTAAVQSKRSTASLPPISRRDNA